MFCVSLMDYPEVNVWRAVSRAIYSPSERSSASLDALLLPQTLYCVGESSAASGDAVLRRGVLDRWKQRCVGGSTSAFCNFWSPGALLLSTAHFCSLERTAAFASLGSFKACLRLPGGIL